MPNTPNHISPYYFDYVSREIRVGELSLGGNNPVRIQSMTNTPTSDIPSTVSQIRQLAQAGCDIVRLAVQNRKEAEMLPVIKKELKRSGVQVPLVADVHFNPEVAEVAARYVEKVRINPGNYVDRNQRKTEYSEKDNLQAVEQISRRLKPLLEICKQEGTAIRIGVNHGSLSERILVRYGNTPEGMVESAMEFIGICHSENFDNLTLSLKASDVLTMTEANKLLVKRMKAAGYDYPLHLGVTEAGSGEDARMKSIAGIGSLLASGIGDTVRVSLTEDPVNEIPVAKDLVKYYGRNKNAVSETIRHSMVYRPGRMDSLKSLTGQRYPVVVSGVSQKAEIRFDAEQNKLITSENRKIDVHLSQNFPVPENSLIRLSYPEALSAAELTMRAVVDFTLLAGHLTSAGIWIETGATAEPETSVSLSLKILQALGKRFSQAAYVACPSCGRSQFNVIEKLEEVKKATSHLKGLKIAVMGCVVNGIGEMGDADYGFVGAGPGKVTLYRSGRPVLKNIEDSKAVELLIHLIRQGDDWNDPEM